MTDKQINKWLRRQFSPIGWGLVAFYGILNLLAALGIGVEVLKQLLPSIAAGEFPQIDWNSTMNNGWGYIAAVLTVLAIAHAWKGPDHFRREVCAKVQPLAIREAAILLCLCIGAQMVNTAWITMLETVMNLFGRSVLEDLEAVSGATDTFSMFLYASIVAPIGEELLFRGYLLRALRPYGKRFAILASALLFGLFHGNLLQAPYAFLVGLILGYVTVEHSIGWAVGIHMFNNLVLADLLTRLTMGWSEIALGILNLTIFGSCFVASAVILTKNRSRIREYRENEWIDRRVLKCFFLNSGILALTVLMVGNMILMLFA